MIAKSNIFCLYGHLFEDEIYYLDEFPKEDVASQCSVTDTRQGGTDNFYRRFSEINKSKIHRFEIKNKAVIIINKQNGSRTALVSWNNGNVSTKFKIVKNCKWAHIMYLDKLDINVEFLKQLKKNGATISADLCLSTHDTATKKKLKSYFKYIDYLITSTSEVDDINSEISLCKSTIIHNPAFTVVDDNSITANPNYEKNVVNTLGAGDFFAAEMVNNLMNGNDKTTSANKAAEASSLYVKGKIYG